MATAALIVTLLTLAASLASWLFGQWLAKRTRISSAALAVGGGGAVLLIASVAFVILGASTWWPRLVPIQDLSPPVEPAPTLARSLEAWPIKIDLQPAVAEEPAAVAEEPPQDLPEEPPQGSVPQPGMEANKAEMLAAAEAYLEQSQYSGAIDIAREYLSGYPRDSDMRSMLARSLFAAEHPGSAATDSSRFVTSSAPRDR